MNQFQQLAYCIYDHLGNTRVNFTPILGTDVNGNCELQDVVNFAADYYPYVCIEQSFNSKILRQYEQVPEKYITTQHERDEETGLDYRGARFYDSDIARFLSLDPHASNYPSLSDYSYVGGMPTIAIDPDGKDIFPTNGITKKAMNNYAESLVGENYYEIFGENTGSRGGWSSSLELTDKQFLKRLKDFGVNEENHDAALKYYMMLKSDNDMAFTLFEDGEEIIDNNSVNGYKLPERTKSFVRSNGFLEFMGGSGRWLQILNSISPKKYSERTDRDLGTFYLMENDVLLDLNGSIYGVLTYGKDKL